MKLTISTLIRLSIVLVSKLPIAMKTGFFVRKTGGKVDTRKNVGSYSPEGCKCRSKMYFSVF